MVYYVHEEGGGGGEKPVSSNERSERAVEQSEVGWGWREPASVLCHLEKAQGCRMLADFQV